MFFRFFGRMFSWVFGCFLFTETDDDEAAGNPAQPSPPDEAPPVLMENVEDKDDEDDLQPRFSLSGGLELNL